MLNYVMVSNLYPLSESMCCGIAPVNLWIASEADNVIFVSCDIDIKQVPMESVRREVYYYTC